MTKMITEAEMSLQTLYTHMLESGIERIQLQLEDECVMLHTENGTGYSIALIEDKKFIRFSTALPLRRNVSYEQKIAYANHLNSKVFLPCFCITTQGNIGVSYVMPYRLGVIAAQFMNIVRRFGSMLEFIEQAHNDDGLIEFEISSDESNESPDLAQISQPKGCLLN